MSIRVTAPLPPPPPLSPAYSMGLAFKDKSSSLGPGPAAYKPDGKFTAHGKAGGPYAFATWKPKDPLEKKTPGPTDYDTVRKVGGPTQ